MQSCCMCMVCICANPTPTPPPPPPHCTFILYDACSHNQIHAATLAQRLCEWRMHRTTHLAIANTALANERAALHIMCNLSHRVCLHMYMVYVCICTYIRTRCLCPPFFPLLYTHDHHNYDDHEYTYILYATTARRARIHDNSDERDSVSALGFGIMAETQTCLGRMCAF